MILVVNPAEVREIEMARDGGRLAPDALHQIAIAADDKDAIGEQLQIGPVKMMRLPARGRRHADAHSHALAEGAGGHLHARCAPILGMPRCLAADLTEILQVVECEAFAVGLAHIRQKQH